MEFNIIIKGVVCGASKGIPTVSTLSPNLIMGWLVSSHEGIMIGNNDSVRKYFLILVNLELIILVAIIVESNPGMVSY